MEGTLPSSTHCDLRVKTYKRQSQRELSKSEAQSSEEQAVGPAAGSLRRRPVRAGVPF